jgi:hypothetical protein
MSNRNNSLAKSAKMVYSLTDVRGLLDQQAALYEAELERIEAHHKYVKDRMGERWLAYSGMEHFIARFDQCVIDHAPGMMDQLATLQAAMYDARTQWIKLYAPSQIESDWIQLVERRILDRVENYNKLLKGNKSAYDTLLELTKQLDMAKTLVSMALAVDRGGQRPDPLLNEIYERCAPYVATKGRKWTKIAAAVFDDLRKARAFDNPVYIAWKVMSLAERAEQVRAAFRTREGR